MVSSWRRWSAGGDGARCRCTVCASGAEGQPVRIASRRGGSAAGGDGHHHDRGDWHGDGQPVRRVSRCGIVGRRWQAAPAGRLEAAQVKATGWQARGCARMIATGWRAPAPWRAPPAGGRAGATVSAQGRSRTPWAAPGRASATAGRACTGRDSVKGEGRRLAPASWRQSGAAAAQGSALQPRAHACEPASVSCEVWRSIARGRGGNPHRL